MPYNEENIPRNSTFGFGNTPAKMCHINVKRWINKKNYVQHLGIPQLLLWIFIAIDNLSDIEYIAIEYTDIEYIDIEYKDIKYIDIEYIDIEYIDIEYINIEYIAI